jgi:polysaccharide export outer membrane protein
LIGFAASGLAGCASGIHYAQNLPPEYQIPSTTHGTNLDLARLAMPKEDSDAIGAGDVLEVTLVSGYEAEDQLPVVARVSEAGMVHVPLVGPVPVVGLEPAQAEQTIARYSIERGVYRQPHVAVVVKEKRRNHVTVMGAVTTPGVVALDRASSDLLSALATAGGLTETAGTEIQILRKVPSNASALANVPPAESAIRQASYAPQRGGEAPRIAQQIDLSDLAQGIGGDYGLGDGDVVVVSEKEPRFVYVMGLVREPQEIEIPFGRDLRVLQAITQAGGRQFEVADKVHVIRRLPHMSEPIVIEVSIRDAKKNGDANLVLGANDVVSIEETPLTFAMGALQQFMRFGISGSVPLF